MAATQYSAGAALQDMALASGGGGRTVSNGIVANPGGLQPGAVLLTAAINRIAVVATAGDSVSLPPAVGGQCIFVTNAAALSANVFESSSAPVDTINGVAGTTAYPLAGGKTVCFVSPAPAIWHALLSA